MWPDAAGFVSLLGTNAVAADGQIHVALVYPAGFNPIEGEAMGSFMQYPTAFRQKADWSYQLQRVSRQMFPPIVPMFRS